MLVYNNLDIKDPLFKIKDAINKQHKNRADELLKEWVMWPNCKRNFVEKIKKKNRDDIIEGWLDGWWDLDDNFNPISNAIVFRISDFNHVKNPTLAHVMAAAKIFPSVGQARKNGWDRPLATGEWQVTKKKYKVRVVD